MSMLKKVKMVAFGLLGAVLFFAAGNNVMAMGTPDGETPAEEIVCDGLSGAAFGLCNAYCEAMDCESAEAKASQNACDTIKGKLLVKHGVDVSGGCVFNGGGAECPCDVAAFEVGLEAQFGEDLFQSNCNPDSSNSVDADITWVNLAANDPTAPIATYSISDSKCTLVPDGTALPEGRDLTPEEAADCVNKAGAICDECEPPVVEPPCPCVTQGLWDPLGAQPIIFCGGQYGNVLIPPSTGINCNVNDGSQNCSMTDAVVFFDYFLSGLTAQSQRLEVCGFSDNSIPVTVPESQACADILDSFCF